MRIFPARFLSVNALMLAGGIAIYSLLVWLIGSQDLTAFTSRHTAMAPITACLLLVFCILLILRVIVPRKSMVNDLTLGFSLFVLLCSGAELGRMYVVFPLPWDSWGFGIEKQLGDPTVGRMAPFTAVTLFLTGLATIAQLPRFSRWRLVQRAGLVTALVGLGSVPLANHAHGSFSRLANLFAPMSQLSAIAIPMLLAGLVLMYFSDWRERRLGRSNRQVPPEKQFFIVSIVLAAFTGMIVVGAVGYTYLHHQKQEIEQMLGVQLNAVAELKVEEITSWRNERLNDARTLAQLPSLREALGQGYLPQSQEDEAWARITAYLQTLRESYDYDHVMVYDRDGQQRVHLAKDNDPGDEIPAAIMQAVARSPDLVSEDLREGEGTVPHLEIFAPVRANAGRDFVGVVRLVMHAQSRLYRILALQPNPSQTGETLIVRQEGDQILYLSPLQHGKFHPFSLRLPANHPTLLAAQILRGTPGTLQRGTDYRDQLVLGLGLRVTGTRWTIICKLDQAEAYQALHEDLVNMLLVFGLILLLLAYFLRNWWQQHHLDLAHKTLESDRAARRANERLALVLQHAHDSIFLFDAQMRIVEANAQALSTYGYTQSEMLALQVEDLRSPGTQAKAQRDFSHALESTGYTFETMHRTRLALDFPVEVSTRRVDLDDGTYILSIVRDITQRKQNEREIEQLNRAYRVISEIDQAMVRLENREQLFPEICRILVEVGGFRLVWIGWLNPDRQALESVASVGDEFGYLKDLVISLDPTRPESHGPSGTAFRANQIHLCNDVQHDPAMRPWRDRAIKAGFNSSIALPIQGENGTEGVLNVYAAETNAFLLREVELLKETAMEVSFALSVFENRRKHRLATEALRMREEIYSSIVQLAPDAIGLIETDTGRFLEFNQAAHETLGYTREEYAAFTLADVEAQLSPEEILRNLSLIRQAGGAQFETKHRHRDGSIRVMRVSARHITVRGKDCVAGIWTDVTEAKRAEEKLRKLSLAMEQSPLSIVITDLQGAIEYVNPHFTQTTGYVLADVVGQNPRLFKSNLTEQSVYEELWGTITKGRVWRGEIINRKKNGDTYTESVLIAPVSDAAGHPTHFIALKEDITARKLTEEALKKSRSQYRIIAENTSDCIWIYDLTAERFVYASPSLVKLRGYTFDEMLGQKLAAILSHESAARFGQDLPRRVAGFLAGEHSHRTKVEDLEMWRQDGTLVPTETISTLLLDETGQVHQILGVSRDISERRRADEALRASEERFRELFDLESDAIVVFDVDSGQLVQANQAAAEVYGYTVDRLLTMQTHEISAEPEATKATRRSIPDKVGEVVQIARRLHRRQDGTVFPVEINMRAFRRGGRLLSVAVIRDITEQVRAQEQMKNFNAELEQKVIQRTQEIEAHTREMQGLLQSIPDMVMRLHRDGTVLNYQAAKGDSPLANIPLRSESQAPFRQVADLFTVVTAAGAQTLAMQETVVSESLLDLPGGRITIEFRVAPISADEYVVFARDITARKRLEEDTLAMLGKERELSEMKTRFISVISHEFRTPMAAAMGSVELLKYHHERLTQQKRVDLLDRVTNSLLRMADMLDDVLQLNRMDAKRTEVQLNPVDLALFARQVIDEARLADRDAHPLLLQVDGDMGQYPTDTNLLRHILSNLLSNAVRYSPAGKPVRMEIQVTPANLRITVEDEGIGVPESDRDKIFSPFERGTNVGNIKGTGLGLNIVLRMTQLLGGTITLDSELNRGSRFTLNFPRNPEIAPTP